MSQCLQTTSACGTSEAYNTTMSVTVGQVVVAQGYCNAVGATGTGGLRIDWLNSAGTLISSSASLTTVTGTSGWVLCKVVATAPATAISARLAFFTNSCAAGYFQFDDSLMQLQSSSLDEVPQGSTYKSVTAVDSNGKALVDFSQSGHLNKTLDNIGDGTTYVRPKYINSDGTLHASTLLNPQGSILPTQSIALTNSTTATSITIGTGTTTQVLYRPDGSTLSVAAQSQTFSGLTASTTYYFYPYIGATSGTLGFSGGVLSASSALYSLQSWNDGRVGIPYVQTLAGTPVYYITTSASGRIGGGSGGGTCPEGDELVEEQTKGIIAAKDVQLGDWVKGYSFATATDNVYRKVIQIRNDEAAIWRMVDGHRVSPCEAIYHESTWKPAFTATGAMVDYSSGLKVQLSLDADNYSEQNYYLVSGTPLLIHNLTGNGVSES